MNLPRSDARRSRLQLRLVLPLLVVVVAVVNRGRIGGVTSSLGEVRLQALVVVAGLVAAHRAMTAMLHRASVDGVSFRRMLVAAEAHAGASHSVIGGAGIGTGLRVAMLRSWGVDPLAVAAAVTLTSIVPSFAMWILAGWNTVPVVVRGDAGSLDAAVATASVLVLVGGFVAVRWVLAGTGVPQIVLRTFERGVGAVTARSPRVGAWITSRLPAEPGEVVADVRCRARSVVRRNGAFLLLSAIGSQLVLALLFAACVDAVAPDAPVSVTVLLRTFALLRVASAFVPLPSGIGVVDVGLTSVLQHHGLAPDEALAAVTLYRSFTFVLPIVTGPLCALAWWLRSARR